MVQSIFPKYSSVLRAERAKLIQKLIDGSENQTKAHQVRRRIPVFRYIPSRYIIQRLIVKATLLPKDFK